MDFFDLLPDARDARVRGLFGLDRNVLNGLVSGNRVAVVAFGNKYPPKLVILQECDMKLLEYVRIAVYFPERGWL